MSHQRFVETLFQHNFSNLKILFLRSAHTIFNESKVIFTVIITTIVRIFKKKNNVISSVTCFIFWIARGNRE